MKKNGWHTLNIEETVNALMSSPQEGLDKREAERRLGLVGYNRLTEKEKISVGAILAAQFTDFMVLVLLAAALISGLLGEWADAVTIFAIILVNAILGFVQEYKAERSLEALKKMTAPAARVIRSGLIISVAAEELVPGDSVLLETGDIIPADLRLCEAAQLEISEASLTGESLPVKKRAQEVYAEATPLGDRRNMAYMGTVVTRGKGQGLVAGTGMHTEMGEIAGFIQQIKEEDTPLQKRLAQLGRWLVAGCLLIVAVVSVSGILRGEEVFTMILTGVSLAVAAIPEGLPAIVTVALAIGVQKMVKRQAIVRALPAVETLGCATVICSDKTGTLTQNEMTVRKLYLGTATAQVSGEGYEPHGKFIFAQADKEQEPLLPQALKIAALCNNAVLQKDSIPLKGLFRQEKGKSWQISGDPTEGALLVAAAKAGIWREAVEQREKRLWEIPFDADRKRMSVIYEAAGGKRILYCKGAPDVILNLCTKIQRQGEPVALTPELREEVLAANDRLAEEALRVLGLAYRELPGDINIEEDSLMESELVFAGLAGMIDPPRESAKKAVSVCRLAGIKTVMITGDHKKTAEAVARELGILTNPSQVVLTGQDMDTMSDYQLRKIIHQTAVYARVSPKHKLRIVQQLKEAGHIVAMTGDGVNDAPAVKEADIGVAMGVTGTDVTKEASSLILGNDDFATIVAAVEEGRIIYDNIRKFIRYLLSCNIGEVLTMFFATLLGLPLPLLPIQILWMNLVTDGLPAIALGMDSGDPDIMTRKPRSPKESVFAHGLMRRIIVRGTVFSAAVLFVYIVGFFAGGKDLDLARTMAFTALVFIQLFYVFDCRSERYSIFELGFTGNKYLVGAVAISMCMQLAVIYIPAFQGVFRTVPLELWHWLLIFAVTIATTLLQGLYRAVKIRRKRRIIYVR
ncbi:MAG: calcium-translocating P-type ATPase, SERCA-type [Clostridia bacterium]|jgi:Ca2+-transporting ATPase|nr:calcium-translocating P-type ATPase, SERCA-type [Clostridia bacterium]